MTATARRRITRCACEACFYCDAPLSSRHEHDHFPLPFKHGGDQQVPCCLNCHDLKDRLPIENWPLDALAQAWLGLTPLAKILVSKLIAGHFDHESRKPNTAQTAAGEPT